MELFSEEFFEETINEYTEIKSLLNKSQVCCYLKEDGEEESKGFIGNAFDRLKALVAKILEMIKGAINRLSNKISYMCLSKESKQKYDEFEKFAKSNPSVKNKTVTVKDWRRIEREYGNVRKNIVNMMSDSSVDANGLTMKTRDMINNLGAVVSSSTAALTVDAAMMLAKKSPEAARMVQQGLLSNQEALNNISNELGRSETRKLQKRVEALTKESVGRKLLVELGLKEEKDLTDCMTEVVNSFAGLVKTGVGAVQGTSSMKDNLKTAKEHKELVRTGIKAYARNKDVRTGVKQIAGLKSGAEATKANIENAGRAAANQVQYATQDPLGFAIDKFKSMI